MKLETVSPAMEASESVETSGIQQHSQKKYFDTATEETITPSAVSLDDHTSYNTPIKCPNTSRSDFADIFF